jgi:hypothetical protein
MFKLLILSSEDGFKSLRSVNIFVRCERNVFLRRNIFKHIGDRQLLEIFGISAKEIMLFLDHGAIVLRLSCGHNQSSVNYRSSSFRVK